MLIHNLENRNSVKKTQTKLKFKLPPVLCLPPSRFRLGVTLPKIGHGLDSTSCSTRSKQQEVKKKKQPNTNPNTNTSSPNNTQAAAKASD